MAKIEIQPFVKAFDTTALEELYQVEISLDAQPVNLQVWFMEKEQCEEQDLQKVKAFIEQLDLMYAKAKKHIQEDFEKGGAVKELIIDHLEQFEKEDFSTLGVDENQPLEKQTLDVFSKTHVCRIALYPEDEENFAIFDFTMNKEVTQYVWVVNFNHKGEIGDEVYIES